MIRVCYLVDAPFLGGAEHYVSRIARGLDRSAFSPSLVVGTVRGDDGRLAAWADSLAADGVPVARVEMNLPFRPWHAPRVLRAIESMAPDIAHVNMPGPYSGQMGLLALLSRAGGARAVVTTEHLPMVAPLWKRALVRRVAYHYADVVLTVCRANVDYLTGLHAVSADRIEVVPNGLRDDYGQRARPRAQTRAALGIPSDRVVVLFLGNLIRHKGLHRAIDALHEIGGERWHLVVGGTGPEEARCRARVESLGLGARVSFLGAVAPGEVEDVVSAADILTLPSTVEGMPYVILEAMACGVAVVATSVYGIPEMIEDGIHGLLVPPRDRVALRGALSRLIDDPAARAAMGAAGRERFAAEFTLSRQLAAVERVYRRVLGVGMP